MTNELKESISQLRNDLKRHMEVEEITMRTYIEILNELRADVKDLKSSHEQNILKSQEHVEAKISSCNTKITETLKTQYMTKDAIEAYSSRIVSEQTDKRNEAINGLRKRLEHEFDEKIQATEGKAKLIAWVAGTIMGIITTAIGLAVTLVKAFQ